MRMQGRPNLIEDADYTADLVNSPVTVGLVFRTSLGHVAKLVKHFEEDGDVNLIFVRKSSGKLFINYERRVPERRGRPNGSDWR